MSDIESLIKKIQGLSHYTQIRRNFPSYIKKIHFPFFRNLQLGSEISFDFPLTVFIGQNGCGKSSALQALYGCPGGNSTGDYWFNTATDPIPEQKHGLRPSYWYEYYHPEANQIVQVLKYRSSYNKSQGADKEKRVNPDYWEPARPGAKYGMVTLKELPKDKLTPGRSVTRWETIKKEVKYLDFRSVLSAFDKYFYFGDQPKTQAKIQAKIRTKQDLLRLHSNQLKKVFDNTTPIFYRTLKDGKKKPTNHPCIDLNKEELQEICTILEKNYKSAKILKHSFYKQEGVSVHFTVVNGGGSELTYTEAFAGSGEMSVVTLVHEVLAAQPNSLILLDEPEVSLHPGAQKRMLQFLLKMIVEKRHQIILCTHSPALIEKLPPKAIKLFAPDPEGCFKIYPEIQPDLAFLRIGQTVSSKKQILVEDEAAKQLIDKILSQMDHQKMDLYTVGFHAGGAKDIFKEALAFSRVSETGKYFILDGDQKPAIDIDLGHLGDDDLNQAIKDFTGIAANEFHYAADGGSNTQAQLIQEKRKFLKYLNDYFRFLPGEDPEDAILLGSSYEGRPQWDEHAEGSAKDEIKKWVDRELGESTSSDISTYRKKLLNSINLEHPFIKAVIACIP